MRKMIIDIYPPAARSEVLPVSFTWFGVRSLVLIFFVTLSAVFINAVGPTAAYFLDTETSHGNFFSAASLDFTVKSEKKSNNDCENHDDEHDEKYNGDHRNDRGDNNHNDDDEDCDDNSNLSHSGSITQFATISNGGSLDFQYTIKVEETGGDDNFCQALNLEAELEGATRYTGKLMDFVSLPVRYSTFTDDWKFVIFLPNDVHAGGSCSFDFIFSGWQTTLPEFGGFSNIERVDDPVHSVASVTVKNEDNILGTIENLATSTESLVATGTEPIAIIEVTTTPIVTEEATTTIPTSTPAVTEESTTTPIITPDATTTTTPEKIDEVPPPIVEPEVIEPPAPPVEAPPNN